MKWVAFSSSSHSGSHAKALAIGKQVQYHRKLVVMARRKYCQGMHAESKVPTSLTVYRSSSECAANSKIKLDFWGAVLF